MATTQHYLWASGHFLLLIASLRYSIAVFTWKVVSAWWYKAGFLGALMSYAIVCNKSLGTPQPNLAYIRRALLDENVQYFLMALFWWTSTPITFTLFPYMIFSLFHALTFTRTTLMPQLLQSPPNASGQPQPHPLAKKLQGWVKANYDTAMKVVAYIELIILARVFFGALLFRNSLLAPVIYVHFLRQRYYQSAFTRDAVHHITTLVEHYIINRPGNPPAVPQVWKNGKSYVQRWAGVSLQPNAGVPEGEAPRR